MKINRFSVNIVAVIVLLGLSISANAQKGKAKTAAKAPTPIIFAVLNDGQTLEPIANVSRGKLSGTVDGGDDAKKIAAFNKSYYKPGTKYRLVFGGASSGIVTVKSSDPTAECTRNIATAVTSGNKTPLRGLVMGLATNAAIKSPSSYRRKPTAGEKSEMDDLVRSEFAKQKVSAKNLHYHNLTGMDLDHDGTAEFVGSYWVDVDKDTRGLLFFIAAKRDSGKYGFGYSEYRSVEQSNVMSGDIKSVDEGVYHELLLDAFDHDGDGNSEVFTYTQSFEGAGFNVYRQSKGNWVRSFEGSNYHCGF